MNQHSDVTSNKSDPTTNPGTKIKATSDKDSTQSASDKSTDTKSDKETDTKSDTTTPADPKKATPVIAKNKTPATTRASALAEMLVQATIRAGKGAVTDKTTAKDATVTTDQTPTDDVAALLARLTQLVSQTKGAPNKDATTDKTSDTTTTTDDTAKDKALPATGAPDLSSLIVQAALLASKNTETVTDTTTAATTTNVTVTAGKEIPLSGQTKVLIGNVTKEKKSDAKATEGSFLQDKSGTSTTVSTLSGLFGHPPVTTIQATDPKQVASNSNSNNSYFSNLLGSASPFAGTANVEKGQAMNADSTISQIAALSGFGQPASGVQQTHADLHIQLSSNNDFHDALKQVMHVAQLNDISQARTPMRVAIEVQTPPGAIVNVYVSRQNDQWRAQLSTNDPQALTWVQDKMNSIRASDVGVEVKWLPPQMENTTGNESNLAWDRGGQNQSQYQQPEDRSQRQKRDAEPDLVGASQFMNTLSAVGEAA